jgi:hypothetical protein
MLRFLAKPNIGICESLPWLTQRWFGVEAPLFNAIVVDPICQVLRHSPEWMGQFDPTFHCYLLSIRDSYSTCIDGFLKYLETRIRIDQDSIRCRMVDVYSLNTTLKNDSEVLYAYTHRL